MMSCQNFTALYKRGRTFESEKATSIDIRRAIADEIVLAEGDIIAKFFQGKYEDIATKFHIARSWLIYSSLFFKATLNRSGCVE